MNKTLIIAAAIALTGCASKMGNVIPQSGGTYQVTTTGAVENKALKSALFSAESTCKARHMRHIITSQKTTYKGMVSEDTNKALNKAADLISSIAFLPIPTLSSDDDYQIMLAFVCEA